MMGWVAGMWLVATAATFQVGPSESGSGVEEVWFEVAGSSARALCTSDAPRVLFLHDVGRDADAWLGVLESLDPDIGACAYDRLPELGEGGLPSPRGWFELMDELRAIHDALGARPGYVLVGEGMGAMYARLFASSRPGAVSGLLLIEPVHEDLPGLLEPGMPSEDRTRWMALRSEPNEDGVREADLAERARRARTPRMPLTVITAMSRPVPEGWNERFVHEAARRAHESLVRGRTYGRHVPARAPGPDVAYEEPGLVAEEIARVIRLAGGF
jgi:pimeloyl-ACP methyl ester carboxylesterase